MKIRGGVGVSSGTGSGDSQACRDSGLGSAPPLPPRRGPDGPEPLGWSRGEELAGWGAAPWGPEGAPPSCPACRCGEDAPSPAPSRRFFLSVRSPGRQATGWAVTQSWLGPMCPCPGVK